MRLKIGCRLGNRAASWPCGSEATRTLTNASSETTLPYNAKFEVTTCGQYPGIVEELRLHFKSVCENPNTGKLSRRNTLTKCSSSEESNPKTALAKSVDS